MEESILEKAFYRNYRTIKYHDVNGRYLHPNAVNHVLEKFGYLGTITTIGKSVLGKPIYALTFGQGSFKVLAWSQMHGNESTTTKAVLDVLNSFKTLSDDSLVKDVLSKMTIKIILQLNPDGCEAYTRTNANGIDLNRDAHNLTQPESQALRKVYDRFKPHLCLNLHDQRTIFNVSGTHTPATVSFLAPAANPERTITPTRAIAMDYIVKMNNVLQQVIKDGVGRYDDSYNENCVGDKFQTLGVPTILFEAGHYPKDYMREKTRKLIYISIIQLFAEIVADTQDQEQTDSYFNIPDNAKQFVDVLVTNVRIKGKSTQIGIQYTEKLIDDAIKFIPVVHFIGNKDDVLGHRTINAHGKELTINTKREIVVGTIVSNAQIAGKKIEFLD